LPRQALVLEMLSMVIMNYTRKSPMWNTLANLQMMPLRIKLVEYQIYQNRNVSEILLKVTNPAQELQVNPMVVPS
jgi:hypothetical protein